MRKTITALGLATLMSVAPMTIPTADAGHKWLAGGSAFRVGGVAFTIVVGHFGRPHADYYWRSSKRLHYGGYQCTDRCLFDDGAYYHSPDCPLVNYHLGHYGHDPRAVWANYAPHYGGDYGGYDRNDRGRYDDRRYDDRRYDDRRYDDRRYDDRRRHPRDRGRGHHRHGSSCRH